MEYVYAAMLIHKAGKKVDEATVKKVLEAAGVSPNEAKIKALVAALENVNIDEAVKKAAVVQSAPAVSASAPAAQSNKEDAAKKAAEDKKKEEEAAAGLGALFG